jgi:hypothetical protein
LLSKARPISGTHVHRVMICCFSMALAATVCFGQTLKRRSSSSEACLETHVRFTARKKDGSPASGITTKDLRISFTLGGVDLVSIKDGMGSRLDKPYTNILLVVPPYADLNDSLIKTLVKKLMIADNFRLNVSVLGPDGSLSPFTTDLGIVQSALNISASRTTHWIRKSQWPPKELEAFIALRKLPGRHILVFLMNESGLHESREKMDFRHDQTFDTLAMFDMTQVYRLIRPVPSSLSIPGGDASSGGGASAGGASAIDLQWQLQQVQNASAAQSAFWARKLYGTASGGRAEDSIGALVDDLLRDASGSYDLVIKPKFKCQEGEMYSLSVSSLTPNVRLFAPQVIQMLPN